MPLGQPLDVEDEMMRVQRDTIANRLMDIYALGQDERYRQRLADMRAANELMMRGGL